MPTPPHAKLLLAALVAALVALPAAVLVAPLLEPPAALAPGADAPRDGAAFPERAARPGAVFVAGALEGSAPVLGGVVGEGPGVLTGSGPLGFLHYRAPEGLRGAHGAGETNLGVNPLTNAAMFQMGLGTARVTWDDGSFPPVATWTDVTYAANGVLTFDPILWTDPATGRTFVPHLLLPCSNLGITDTDGASWMTAQPPCSAPSFDHQTLGGGPYALGVANPVYPSALYYCAQGLVLSQCSRSDDGGLTWGAATPMNAVLCGTRLHGKVVVGPDGTAYVPHKGCQNRQALVYSQDLGTTWRSTIITNSLSGLSDPVLAIDDGGRLYVAMSSGGRAVVATSPGLNNPWASTDLGAAFNITNTRFPMAVGGDAGRAAVAFYGTPTGGNDQAAGFQGAWHLYVAFTQTAGASWEVYDLTPDDPVQRGCIWMQGGSNPCRNLLDFQGMALDAEGRILIGYADGCTSPSCVAPAGQPSDSRDSLGVIARQVTGPRLRAAFDPAGPEPILASAGGPYRTDAGVAVALGATAVGGVPPLGFAWDLDNDGAHDDAAGPAVSFTGPAGGGRFPVSVRVQDSLGAVAVAASEVRVRDPASQVLAAAWDFDAAGCADDLGWSHLGPYGVAQADALAWHLRAFHASTGACAWYHGIDALNKYRPSQGSNLNSPGGSGCFDLAGAVSGRFEFQVAGFLETGYDYLEVRAGPCDAGSFPTLLTRLTGPHGSFLASPPVYVNHGVDLTPLAAQGPFQVQLRVVTDTLDEREGYQVDAFRLYVQA